MMAARRPLPSWLAEAIGTAILLLLGLGAIMMAATTQAFGAAGISVTFGALVCGIILWLGPSSGAHLNPAVTLALWSMQRLPGRLVLPYIAAQCVGATLAALTLRSLLGAVANLGATVPSVSLPWSFLIEAGYSALLMLVILAVADRRYATPQRARLLPAIVIGATVMVGAYVTGPLTGGSFNPARSFGPAVAGMVWTAHWVYWAAPITGMIVAAQGWQRRPLRGLSKGQVDPGASH